MSDKEPKPGLLLDMKSKEGDDEESDSVVHAAAILDAIKEDDKAALDVALERHYESYQERVNRRKPVA